MSVKSTDEHPVATRRTMAWRAAAFLTASLSMPQLAAAAPHWQQPYKQDHCVASGVRQFSSRLLDAGANWEKACAATPADVVAGGARTHFDRPTRCKKVGVWPAVEMWGEFDARDPSCDPRWGSFSPRQCTSVGHRQYSSRLENVPPGVDWEAACQATQATVNGTKFENKRCKKVQVGPVAVEMWGEVDVPDDSCRPKLGALVKTGGFLQEGATCSGPMTRSYPAQVQVPDGLDWLEACWTVAADVAGVHFAKPSRCEPKGPLAVGGMWAYFDVSDASCIVDWRPLLTYGGLAVLILALVLGIRLVARRR